MPAELLEAIRERQYPIDWRAVRDYVGQQKRNGEQVRGGLPHGHTFLRLQDIRGLENRIFDMVNEEPNLKTLIQMVEDFNQRWVASWLALKPDLMCDPEDLGMQVGPMIAPELFRRYVKPVEKLGEQNGRMDDDL